MFRLGLVHVHSSGTYLSHILRQFTLDMKGTSCNTQMTLKLFARYYAALDINSFCRKYHTHYLSASKMIFCVLMLLKSS